MIIHEAHVGTTRCVIWSIDQIIKIQARVPLGVVFIRAIIFIFLLSVLPVLLARRNTINTNCFSIFLNSAGCEYVCPAGGYCPQGSANPSPCPGGKYGTAPGQSLEAAACDVCPSGYFTTGEFVIMCNDDLCFWVFSYISRSLSLIYFSHIITLSLSLSLCVCVCFPSESRGVAQSALPRLPHWMAATRNEKIFLQRMCFWKVSE